MPSKNVIEIDDESFDAEVLGSKEPFLLDFTATWCGPCKVLLPILERIADEHVGTLRVGKIDLDTSPGVAARWGVRGAPTVIAFRDGREVGRRLGLGPREAILKLLAP